MCLRGLKCTKRGSLKKERGLGVQYKKKRGAWGVHEMRKRGGGGGGGQISKGGGARPPPHIFNGIALTSLRQHFEFYNFHEVQAVPAYMPTALENVFHPSSYQ